MRSWSNYWTRTESFWLNLFLYCSWLLALCFPSFSLCENYDQNPTRARKSQLVKCLSLSGHHGLSMRRGIGMVAFLQRVSCLIFLLWESALAKPVTAYSQVSMLPFKYGWMPFQTRSSPGLEVTSCDQLSQAKIVISYSARKLAGAPVTWRRLIEKGSSWSLLIKHTSLLVTAICLYFSSFYFLI